MLHLDLTGLLILETFCYSFTTAMGLCYALTLIPRRLTRWGTACLFLVCVGSIAALNAVHFIVLHDDPHQSDSFLLITVLKVLIFQGSVFFAARYRDGRTLFAGVTASMFAILAQLTGDTMYLISGSMLGGMVMGGAMLGLLEYLCVRFIRKPYQRFFQTSSPLFQWMFVIPCQFYVCLYLLAYWPKSLTDAPENVPVCIVVTLLVLISYSLVFSLLTYELETTHAQQREGLLEAYARGLESQNSELREYRLHGRIIRHDLRHFTGALTTLLEEGHTDEALAMLTRMQESASDSAGEVLCENLIVSSVLRGLFHQAKEDGIRLDAQLDIPAQPGRLNSLDLAGVLANLLENAINAVQPLPAPERQISLQAICQPRQLLIVIRNPYRGEIRLDPATGLPLTTHGEGHGFGMRSIAAFMAQNPSEIDLHTENHCFALRLLIRL